MRNFGGLAQFETSIVRLCWRFHQCSAPVCPLDPNMLKRESRQHGEEKCHLQKTTRLRIVQQAKTKGLAAVAALPYGGLTRPEWAGHAWWESRSDEQRKSKLAALAKTAFVPTLRASGEMGLERMARSVDGGIWHRLRPVAGIAVGQSRGRTRPMAAKEEVPSEDRQPVG